MSLLKVEQLKKHYIVKEGLFNRKKVEIRAVDGVSFEVKEGTTYGIAGESGSGKSTLCMCVARLVEPTSGKLYFDGKEYTHAKGEELRRLRAEIQMVFQNPLSSLDPHMVVKDIVLEPVRAQGKNDDESVALDALEKVGLSRSVMKMYPHELSGGMAQRVAIARALTLRPRMLILDEPTSALDASMQAQVLNLFNELQREMKITYLLVSHDLSVIGHMCDSMAVMYAGRIVEIGSYDQLFYEPSHPYTLALLASARFLPEGVNGDKFTLRGEMPSPRNPPAGCTLHPRCPFATDVCHVNYPDLEALGNGHFVACHNKKNVTEALEIARKI
jgi:oligopeptide/dipeptide ABC transporter ATP-binding protein